MMKFCNLFSGSDGNAIFVGHNETKILIDAGVSCKKVVHALESIQESIEQIDGIIITHEHIDHIKGIDVINRKYKTPIYANRSTWKKIHEKFDVSRLTTCHVFKTKEPFKIGDLEIHSFPIPHDAAEPVGFNVLSPQKKISILTDVGHMNVELIHQLKDSDLIYLESNHEEEMVKVSSYPWSLKQRILGEKGHLSNLNAGKNHSSNDSIGNRKIYCGSFKQGE
jgi:phosphoribosyl 1,2-cyclic phosphodiesterase